MSSPFPPSIKTPGEGRIVARRVPEGYNTIEVMSFRYPLKLISPASFIEKKSSIVFILSYGGGLVAGDKVNVDMLVREGARLSLLTQGYTKVFGSDSPDKLTRQTFNIKIERGGSLCLLPDPVQPYAKSIYEQTQIFKMHPESDLVLLDWVSQGRVALNENWDFHKWIGRNEVWLCSDSERLLVRDTVILDDNGKKVSGLSLEKTMYGLGVFGSLILRGNQVQKIGDFFMKEFEAIPRIGARKWGDEKPDKPSDELTWRLQRLSLEKNTSTTWSAARLRGCVVIKFGAQTVNDAKMWLLSMLKRDGTIYDMFGENAMYCIQ